MKKFLLPTIIMAISLIMFVGCGRQQPATLPILPETNNISQEVLPPPELLPTPSPEPTIINVAALRGPTALGLLYFMNEHKEGYYFQLLGSPDEIPPLLVRGDIDIAAIPGNLASVLYNRLDGDVQVLAIVTLGVLHIVDTTGEINSVSDLAGRTIFAPAPGATPEFALNYVLTQNGLVPNVDVNIEFRTEPAEIAALIEAGVAEIALLPEPFVSTVLARVENVNLRIALDLSEEWDRVQPDYSLTMSVVIARREFLENNPEAVTIFLEKYAESIEFMTTNIPEAAQLTVDFGLIPNTIIAESAIPRTNIVFITGEEMKRNLMGFYNVLYNAEPQSVGGALPSERFFFIPFAP